MHVSFHSCRVCRGVRGDHSSTQVLQTLSLAGPLARKVACASLVLPPKCRNSSGSVLGAPRADSAWRFDEGAPSLWHREPWESSCRPRPLSPESWAPMRGLAQALSLAARSAPGFTWKAAGKGPPTHATLGLRHGAGSLRGLQSRTQVHQLLVLGHTAGLPAQAPAPEASARASEASSGAPAEAFSQAGGRELGDTPSPFCPQWEPLHSHPGARNMTGSLFRTACDSLPPPRLSRGV